MDRSKLRTATFKEADESKPRAGRCGRTACGRSRRPPRTACGPWRASAPRAARRSARRPKVGPSPRATPLRGAPPALVLCDHSTHFWARVPMPHARALTAARGAAAGPRAGGPARPGRARALAP
jgi:hypothetical protein